MSNKVTQYLRNSNAVLLAFLMLFSAQAYGQEAPKAEAEPTGHYGDIVYGDPNAPRGDHRICVYDLWALQGLCHHSVPIDQAKIYRYG